MSKWVVATSPRFFSFDYAQAGIENKKGEAACSEKFCRSLENNHAR